MPMDRARYPADWDAIVARIRARAGDRCEWPGCGLRNGAVIHRAWSGRAWPVAWLHCREGRVGCLGLEAPRQPVRSAIRIVLTVAHRCHDPACAVETHLAAWCQAHHLRYDAARHAAHAAETRRRKRRDAGQQELWC